MAKLTKRQKAISAIDSNKVYSLEEAVEVING
ncbi:50S ribosomal protein L1, partial [Pseudomonas syringae]